MQVNLDSEEIEALVEGLDCLKIKIAHVKGATYAEKTQRLIKVESLESKLHSAAAAGRTPGTAKA
jgi:hypothetical protein